MSIILIVDTVFIGVMALSWSAADGINGFVKACLFALLFANLIGLLK